MNVLKWLVSLGDWCATLGADYSVSPPGVPFRFIKIRSISSERHGSPSGKLAHHIPGIRTFEPLAIPADEPT